MAAPETSYGRAPRMVVAYGERRGPYEGIGSTMLELKRWVDSKGTRQTGRPFCLFYDNPGETPEGELRSEACIPVAELFEAEGGFRAKELEETEVAETRHRGPPEEFPRTYGPFLEGLLRPGCRLVGPAREYFASASDVRGPGSGVLIQQPIEKKRVELE